MVYTVINGESLFGACHRFLEGAACQLDLEGFSGIGHSIEDCIYKAKHGMRVHVVLLREQGLPVPPENPCPRIVGAAGRT
jgi:hypothetical protein